MGVDDADECGPDGHDFHVTEIHVGEPGLRMVHECARCGAVTYEASAADR